jgi:tetratricopeptide (TPR) repeat protein
LTQGVYYRDNFNFFEAIKKFKQGVTLSTKSKDSKLSKLNYYLADSYSFVYSDDIAFKYYLKALKLYKQDKNEIGEAYCYNGIGTIYSKTNRKVGLIYLNRALALFIKIISMMESRSASISATEKYEESFCTINQLPF